MLSNSPGIRTPSNEGPDTRDLQRQLSLRFPFLGVRFLRVREAGGVLFQLRRKVRKLGGCRACEIASRSETNTKHGGRKQNTVGSEAIYMVWKGMRARCADKNDPYYGGKGVTRGDRMTIDRIDPAIGYCPENCQWLTGRENSRRMALDHSSRKSADVVH